MDSKIEIKEFLEFVYSFYKTMRDHQVVLVYEGVVTHQIIKAFTSLTETSMEAQMEAPSTLKRVFHVMVECLQNLSKHAEFIESDNTSLHRDGKGIFLLSKGSVNYTVTTGNAIGKEKIPSITTLLDHINSLDKDGLKELYKERIKEGRLSNKGGAGLGFIDVARKTGSELNYHFLPINDEYSFFVLSTEILRNN
ncbi:MAG TPA: SiaB family protein kinase [Salinivirgaceae bacterium]|nr:SiaB family protein kinase [Salinivirgaceae bacterium]HQA75760.1 SiaB family protein kinase [Salinivirgaceae bacterium]